MRLTLRRKLVTLSLVLAVLPLLVAGRSMIQLTRDELISEANEDLLETARQVSREIDGLHDNTWLAPLLLLRGALENPDLGVAEKLALLEAAITQVADFVSLQLSIEDSPSTLRVFQEGFARRLDRSGLDPEAFLRTPPRQFDPYQGQRGIFIGELVHLTEDNHWLVTLILPLERPLAGRNGVLSARIDLFRLGDYLKAHPFNATGTLRLVDASARVLFQPAASGHELQAEAVQLLQGSSRPVTVKPFHRGDGEEMLGAYAFPRAFAWGVVVEMAEEDAYRAVEGMLAHLLGWVAAGIVLALVGALLLAWHISRPVLTIARVAGEVGRGNLRARVRGVTSADEIGELARCFNGMIDGLIERFQLQKFVSTSTVDAIQAAAGRGVTLGGRRREVTVLFSDIRGFTAFAEQVEPDRVIEMLNTCLRLQAGMVRHHGGDIDKYVGDELMAVFQGPAMVEGAVGCALDIQEAMGQLHRRQPDWPLTVGIGISCGEVVMGAVGSEERMDYTVLGDAVNLGARLCARAEGGQILLSDPARRRLPDLPGVTVTALDPVAVKGKARPVITHRVQRIQPAQAPFPNPDTGDHNH